MFRHICSCCLFFLNHSFNLSSNSLCCRIREYLLSWIFWCTLILSCRSVKVFRLSCSTCRALTIPISKRRASKSSGLSLLYWVVYWFTNDFCRSTDWRVCVAFSFRSESACSVCRNNSVWLTKWVVHSFFSIQKRRLLSMLSICCNQTDWACASACTFWVSERVAWASDLDWLICSNCSIQRILRWISSFFCWRAFSCFRSLADCCCNVSISSWVSRRIFPIRAESSFHSLRIAVVLE